MVEAGISAVFATAGAGVFLVSSLALAGKSTISTTAQTVIWSVVTMAGAQIVNMLSVFDVTRAAAATVINKLHTSCGQTGQLLGFSFAVSVTCSSAHSPTCSLTVILTNCDPGWTALATHCCHHFFLVVIQRIS